MILLLKLLLCLASFGRSALGEEEGGLLEKVKIRIIDAVDIILEL